jgi:hypothetical protein
MKKKRLLLLLVFGVSLSPAVFAAGSSSLRDDDLNHHDVGQQRNQDIPKPAIRCPLMAAEYDKAVKKANDLVSQGTGKGAHSAN